MTTLETFVQALPLLRAGPNGRVNLIDAARGLFVVWMIIAHSLSIALIHRDDPLQLLRPAGWTTTCFIMLTGFSVAAVFAWTPGRKARTVASLWHRAWKIGVIAFLSNVFFKASKAWTDGVLSYEFLMRIVMFKEPWSISVFLIPTTLLLIVSPLLLWLATRIRPRQLFAAATVLSLLFGACAHLLLRRTLPSIFEFQFAERFSWFDLSSFVLYGLWGFTLSNMLRKESNLRLVWTILLISTVSAMVFAHQLQGLLGVGSPLALAASHFLVSLEIVLLLGCFASLSEVHGFLVTLGRSALLLFVCHRVVIQAEAFFLKGLLPDRAVAVELISTTLVICLFVALLRQRNLGLSIVLNALGF